MVIAILIFAVTILNPAGSRCLLTSSIKTDDFGLPVWPNSRYIFKEKIIETLYLVKKKNITNGQSNISSEYVAHT